MKAAIKLVCILLSLGGTCAEAQEAPYPSKPITWVVGSGTGGVVDNSARLIAKVLSQKLGQPVIVDNKPGAVGIIAAEAVAHARPDGYTMLYAAQGPVATFPHLYKKLSYDPLTAFEPVNGMGSSSMLMVVNAAAPYKTLEEFIDYARKNPGKLNYGSAGAGGSSHLLGEMLQLATGISMVHVPYKQPANLYADLMSGAIDMIFDFTVVMRPLIEAGRLRPLAISKADRLTSFPDVPTFKERGLDIELTAWSSLAMPAGTPRHIVEKMSQAMAAALREPEIVKYNEENDFGSLRDLGPDQLKAFYISESERFKKVVDKAGIKLD